MTSGRPNRAPTRTLRFVLSRANPPALLLSIGVIWLGAFASEAHAAEPLTQTFVERRQNPIGPYLDKQRSTVENLIAAFRENKLTVTGNKGQPFRLDKLPDGVKRRMVARFRQFARAVVPIQRRATRSVVQELLAEPRLVKLAPYEFDAESGKVRVEIREELWSAHIEFNAYQLGAAVNGTGRYQISRADQLGP